MQWSPGFGASQVRHFWQWKTPFSDSWDIRSTTAVLQTGQVMTQVRWRPSQGGLLLRVLANERPTWAISGKEPSVTRIVLKKERRLRIFFSPYAGTPSAGTSDPPGQADP